MKAYIQKNVIPILIEAAFILSFLFVPEEYAVYTNFVFYTSLAIYFGTQKTFSLKTWKIQLCSGKDFWSAVFWTGVFFMIAFGFTGVLEGMLPDVDTGMIGLRRSNWLELVLFAVSTVFLPPVVEELFYRQSLISFQSKGWMAATALFSTFLFALEHALKPFGILITAIWALPLVVAYIKTKNIYVPMTAHFIANAIGNGSTVIIMAIKLMEKG